MITSRDIKETILAVEQDLMSGVPERLRQAEEKSAMLRPLVSHLLDDGTEAKRGAAVSILTACGHTERALGKHHEAAATYTEALELLEGDDSIPPERQPANLWTCRGLALLSAETEDDWKGAIDCFDRAIELRQSTEATDPSAQWGLSAGWMNRADALTKLGGEPNLREALQALDTAINLLAQFELAANAGFRSRTALAHMNRGNLFARLTLDYDAGCHSESLAAYSAAVDILRPGAEQKVAEPRRMLAVALSNRARARLQLDATTEAEAAEKDSLEALSHIEPAELEDPEMARLMLTTRVTLCHLLAKSANTEEREAELTDVAEEGLQLVLPHAKRFSPELDFILGQLFRQGANAYFQHLPGFLADYLLEFLDPEQSEAHLASSPACHEAAVEVLWQAIGKLQELGFGAGKERDLRLERIHQWQSCRERLAEIRERFLETAA